MAAMHSLSEEQERSVLGELLADKLQAILEYVSEIPGIKTTVERIDARLIKVENTVNMHEFDIKRIYTKVDNLGIKIDK